jgi:hypothetical protein
MMKTLLLALCLTLSVSLSASENQAYRLWLEFDESAGPNLVQIQAYACSRENEELSYRLSLIKNGRSGQSTIQQSGRKHVSSEPTLLATQLISLAADDSYTLTLTLLKQGEIVAYQEFSFPETD